MQLDNKAIKDKSQISSPWSTPRHRDFCFPIRPYENLLKSIGCQESSELLDYWISNNLYKLAEDKWAKGTKRDWLWGLGLPYLAEIEKHLNNDRRSVLAISGLPGSGKSSFGDWLEAASEKLSYTISVVSLDDFYLPSPLLDEAMLGNPWHVPRGIPGSHSLDLIDNAIDKWLDTGVLLTPKFDKSLRGGKGERCGWKKSKPNIVIFEGWFVGCDIATKEQMNESNPGEKSLCLSEDEIDYREKVQNSLINYLPIWKRFSSLWHLKPLNFNSTCDWKLQQENKLKDLRGSSLQGKSLDLFIRMIQTAIPQQSLMTIKSDVVLKIDGDRSIQWVGRQTEEKEAC